MQFLDQLLAFRPRDVKFMVDDFIMKHDKYRTLIMGKPDLQDIPMPLDNAPNAYTFDSGDASAWRVNGGFRLEIPRSV